MSKPDKVQIVKALPSQWEFLNAKEPEVLYSGSAGSGKSRALCLKMVQQACIPGNVALLVRKWLVNLKMTTLRTLLEYEGTTPPVLPPGTYRHNRSEKVIHLYGGGDIIYAGVGDDITRIRSMAAGVVGVDEAIELTEDEWCELKLRARISVGCGQIVGATNPGDTAHWGYGRFINPNRTEEDTRVIYSLSKDNYHLPPHAQRALAMLKGATGERMRDGLWVGIDRLVYGAFPAGIFVGSMPDRSLMQQWYISIDYGFSNPTFILFAGVDCDGRLWIYEEHEKSRLLIDNILNWLDAHRDYAPVVVVDPSAAGLIAEIQSKGFTCIKANNDVKIGIDKSRDVMAAGMVRANATCVNLRRSLTSYVRKPDGNPEKEDDHGSDSFRYLVMAAVGQRIDALLEDLANPPSNYFFGDSKAREEKRDPFMTTELPKEQEPSPFLRAI
jgi:phage terminase large subunit